MTLLAPKWRLPSSQEREVSAFWTSQPSQVHLLWEEELVAQAEFHKGRITFALILSDTNLPMPFSECLHHELVLWETNHWLIPCPSPSHETSVSWFNQEAPQAFPIYQENK